MQSDQNLTLYNYKTCSTLCPQSYSDILYTVHDLKTFEICTVKPVLSGHSKKDKTKVLKTDGRSMQVESLAECSREHSARLFTCIKPYLVLKTILGLFFEWLLKTGITVTAGA